VLVTGRVKPELPTDYWYVLPVDGSKATEIPARDLLRQAGVVLDGRILGSGGAWLRPPSATDDLVLFGGRLKDSANIWQLPLDRKTGRPTGEPTRVTLGQNERIPRSAQNDAPGRRIVFATLDINDDLYSVALDANRGTGAGELQRLTEDLAPDLDPYLSTDGRALLFQSGRGGSTDIWKRTFPATVEAALGVAALKPVSPVLSHDGARIAFTTSDRKVLNEARFLYLASLVGGYPQRICDDCGTPQDFSPDNKLILYVPPAQRTINLLDTESGAKMVVLRHPSWSLFGARFSPDGRWIAFYTTNQQRQVLIAPFQPGVETPPSEWIKVSVGEQPDASPAWSPDGGLLYYLSGRDGFRCVWAQRLVAGRTSGAPFAVIHFHNTRRKPQTTSAGSVGLTVARDKMVVPLLEQTGNIWMASR
jgi:Tol biopolymer transport system component